MADPQAVQTLISTIIAQYGHLNGVIHSAGVVQDRFLLKKTVEELHTVLAPKVDGVINLDEATRELPLDLFVLFSSLAGVMGNAGQADYATANAFLDAYAQYRSQLVAQGQRQGRTLSLNWPLWEEGGMQVDQATRDLLRKTIGMMPMSTTAGLHAL